MWKWHEAKQSKLRVTETNYLTTAFGITPEDAIKNVEVYVRFEMAEKVVGVNCRMVEWV